jgi:pyrrolysine biosynthesis protein PylC
MRVAIAGGALQGLEVTYLARKAGFETLLLDRRADAPATGLCHRFVLLDLTDREALTGALASVDLVLPATENARALQSLAAWCEENGMPLAFDPGAYAISSSKTASAHLFRKMGIPTPAPWPECGFPVLTKPDGKSGSQGVEVFLHQQALEARFGSGLPPGWVFQEYLTGPSYSIEVVGRPGSHTPLQVTALEMDRDHDCKRVLAPSGLPSHLTGRFEETALALAEAVGLSGILDVEVILHEGQLKVLEIDARFPSQTPIAVYRSTGINMVEHLARLFLSRERNAPELAPPRPPGGTVLEHIRVCNGTLSVCGEHVLAEAGPLHLEKEFLGANEALTNHAPGKEEWVATLMIDGSDPKDARECRDRVVGEIRTRFGLSVYRDEYPPDPIGQVP